MQRSVRILCILCFMIMWFGREQLRAQVTTHTDVARGWLERSKRFLAEGEMEAARASYQKGSMMDSELAKTYQDPSVIEGAQVWVKRGNKAVQRQDKMACYNKALAMDKFYAEAWYKIAHTYQTNKNIAEALKTLRKMDALAIKHPKTKDLEKKCIRKGLKLEAGPHRDAARLAQVNLLYKEYQNEFYGIADCTIREYQLLRLKESTQLIDVRTEEEQQVSQIPESLPVTTFEKNPTAYQNHTLVAYCTIGYRSGQFTQEWQEKGFRVINLRGGILAWTHAGEPLVLQGKDTNKVHVYGKKWNLLSQDYESVY